MSKEFQRGYDVAAIGQLTVGEIMMLLQLVEAQLKDDPVMEHLSPPLMQVIAQLTALQKLAFEVAEEDIGYGKKPIYLN